MRMARTAGRMTPMPDEYSSSMMRWRCGGDTTDKANRPRAHVASECIPISVDHSDPCGSQRNATIDGSERSRVTTGGGPNSFLVARL
jgi:hypothetical protein